jgi:hypothetical protein
MQITKVAALTGILLTAQCALADASYQTTWQITGGQFVDAIKGQAFIGKIAGKMFAPTNTIIMVHGNQKAEVTKESTEITDLDKGQIISIDHKSKTYTIVTFAQMRKAMATMPQQIQKVEQQPQPQAQMPSSDIKLSFSTSVNNTGVTKIVNGLTAQEQVITMTTTGTDPNPQPGQPSAINYTMTTDAWIAPDPTVITEIQDFDLRMAQKMMEGVDAEALMASMKASANSNPGMAQMLGGHPGSAEAMAQMTKEMEKIKGTRILEVTSMGGDAPAQPATGSATPAPAQPSQQGSVAGQVATDTATQTASTEAFKLGGTMGSALSNSALGAFRHKKSTPAPAAAPASTPAAGTPGATPGTQRVVLMEMTDQKNNFSHEAIPASAFQIPAGYKQVQSPMGQ